MADEIKKAKAVYRANKAACTRKSNELTALLNSDPIDSEEVTSSIEFIKLKIKTLSELGEDVMRFLEIETEIESFVNDVYDYECTTSKLLLKAEKANMPAVNKPNSLTGSASSRSEITVKLPQLKLPIFDGTVTGWPEFWDSFKGAVDSRDDLTPTQKFLYLKGQIRSEALTLIRSLPVVDATYEKAVTILKNTYCNKLLSSLELVKRLQTIQVKDHRAESVRKFHADFESLLAGIEVLGYTVEGNSTSEMIIIGYFLNIMPYSLKDNILRIGGEEVLTLEKFRAALHTELNLLSSKNHRSDSSSDHKRKEKEKYHPPIQTATVGNYVVANNPRVKKCLFCKGLHRASECDQYSTRQERICQLTKLQKCANCMRKLHNGNCSPEIICLKCKGNHTLPMCPQLNASTDFSANSSQPDVAATVSTNKIGCTGAKVSVVLPTVMLPVKTTYGKIKYVRALVDQCSQKTFLLRNTAFTLGLQIKGSEHIKINTFNGSTDGEYERVDILINCCGREPKFISAVLVDQMPQNLTVPGVGITVEKLKHLNIPLADPNITDSHISSIELLIGADFYYEIVDITKPVKIVENTVLLPTAYGFMLSGVVNSPVASKFNQMCSYNEYNVESIFVFKIAVSNVSSETLDDINNELKKLWELETIGITLNDNNVDDKILTEFTENITFDGQRYTVRFPWKMKIPPLSTNFSLAKGRLRSLVRRLQGDHTNLMKYDKIIKDQLERNFIELVPRHEYGNPNSHYIPHHAVVKNHPTTPIRVVYDGSAKSSPENYSLNDCMYSGPCLVPELVKILLRLRFGKYLCAGDVSKAFLQVSLNNKDKDYTRFLWLTDPNDINSDLITFRFKVVLFGTTASPFLLQATIGHHISNYNCKIIANKELLKRNLYVDNLHGTACSQKDLVDFYNESLICYQSAGLPLREWISNSPMLNKKIMDDDLGPKTQNAEYKLLGLQWNIDDDVIHSNKIGLSDSQKITKRSIVSDSAKVFDPLGLLSPFTISSRVLIQDLWREKLDWDENVHDCHAKRWLELSKCLENLNTMTFPRWVIPSNSTDLHLFSDASFKAYGSCAYIIKNNESNLLMAKCRVAPIKQMTIPKLELMGATLAIRLASYILDALSMEIRFNTVHLWIDSQIVLHWILQNKEQKNIFVKNRVSEIVSKLPNHNVKYHYVNTCDNPADLLTHSKILSNDECNMWRYGPVWLTNTNDWPVNDIFQNLNDKSETSLFATVTPESARSESKNERQANKIGDFPNPTGLPDPERYSAWMKLLRVTCYIFRTFMNNNNKPNSVNITVEELEKSEKVWLKQIQSKYYSNELNYIQNNTSRTAPTPQLVKQLKLYVDNDGLIKCNTRLQFANVDNKMRCPILLPSDDYVTNLIIMDAHASTLHSSTQNVMCYLKSKFYIPKCRQAINKCLKNCMLCRMQKGIRYRIPDTPPFPSHRVNECQPFQFCGVDLTGALYVKGKNSKDLSKMYLVLFTCTATRAIHVEIAPDNTAESFANAFRRFVARRSQPQVMYSDNAGNFKGFEPQLHELQSHPAVAACLLQKRTEWKFIPSRAPWFGSLWERMIGVTKNILKKMLGKAFLNFDELHTIVTEIEARVNSRPLTYVDGAAESLEALTPSHLLYGRSFDLTPSVIDENDALDAANKFNETTLTKRHQHVLSVINKAWERWRKEYLLALRDRDQSNKLGSGGKREPEVGDIVLVPSDSESKLLQLGKITSLVIGLDGFTRVARVRIKSGHTFRAIAKLAFLESSDDVNATNATLNSQKVSSSDKISDITLDCKVDQKTRPNRAAAANCRTAITKLFKSSLA